MRREGDGRELHLRTKDIAAHSQMDVAFRPGYVLEHIQHAVNLRVRDTLGSFRLRY